MNEQLYTYVQFIGLKLFLFFSVAESKNIVLHKNKIWLVKF